MVVRVAMCLAALLLPALTACEPASDVGTASPVATESATAPRTASPPPTPTPAPSSLAIATATLMGSSPNPAGPGAYRYRVEYPRVSGVPDSLDGAIDGAILGLVQRAVNDFVTAAQVLPPTPSPGRPSELSCTTHTVRVTRRLAVMRDDCTRYQAGAARTDALTYTFDVDLAGGRLLTLEDLFSSGAQYLSVLSDQARQQLHALVPGLDDATIAAGTEPVVVNFQAFLLDTDALVVLFPRFQAGTAAVPEVRVPYAMLQRYFADATTQLIG